MERDRSRAGGQEGGAKEAQRNVDWISRGLLWLGENFNMQRICWRRTKRLRPAWRGRTSCCLSSGVLLSRGRASTSGSSRAWNTSSRITRPEQLCIPVSLISREAGAIASVSSLEDVRREGKGCSASACFFLLAFVTPFVCCAALWHVVGIVVERCRQMLAGPLAGDGAEGTAPGNVSCRPPTDKMR